MGEFSVNRMCRVLDVSVSGYYAWRHRPVSQRTQANAALLVAIRRIYTESHGTYGSPRIWAELQATGERCAEKRVARLMHQAQLRARGKGKERVVTTDSRHTLPVASNTLNQAFTATAPNQKWVGDITYIATRQGWLYLAAVLDLFSRRIVGWAMADRIDSPLVVAALTMALQQRRPAPGLLFHCDRGSQYASQLYRQALADHGLELSMSRTGNCYDNAVMESFWSTLKAERTDHQDYHTHATARVDIFRYLEGFYNRQRRHSTLGYLSPIAFEQHAAQAVLRVGG